MYKRISAERAFIRKEALLDRQRLLDYLRYVFEYNVAAIIVVCLRAFGRSVEYCVIQ